MKDKLRLFGGLLTVCAGCAVFFLASLPKLWIAYFIGAALMVIGFIKTIMGIDYD